MLADRYDAFLFDLDGVLMVGDEPLPGATAAVERLHDRGTPMRVVTNNSRTYRDRLAAHLDGAGFEFDPDEVFTAARATAAYLDESGYERASVVGGEGFRREIGDRGLEVLGDGAESGADAVAIGHDEEFTYRDLTRATRQVLDGADLVAANVDTSYPVPDGIAPGTGALVAAVSAAAGVDPEVVGKPEPRLFELALEGLDAERPAMVGDSPSSDVRGAKRAGIDAILVADEEPADGPTPDAVIEDLRGLFEGDG